MYPRLWTLEAETAAAQHRQEIAEGKRSDDLTTDIPYRDGKDKPYLWEEYFYQYYMESSVNEVDAYSHLISFQGTVIPKFYGSGKVLLPPHTRSIQPPAVLIEYKSGKTSLLQSSLRCLMQWANLMLYGWRSASFLQTRTRTRMLQSDTSSWGSYRFFDHSSYSSFGLFIMIDINLLKWTNQLELFPVATVHLLSG